MISSNTYQNSWLQAFLLALLFAFIMPAQADTENEAAAQVLFSHGNVVLTNASSSYPLEKGGFVSAGDTVITGDDGRVQLRFTDGGLVSLMPNTRFAVDEYSQPTEDAEGSVSVNLIKGGLRALSGSIGKKDHDNYKLKTDVATLGIRGTQFVVVMDGAAMRVHVGEGSVALFNNFGQLLVPAGYHAEVFPNKAPSLSKVPAVFVSSPQPNSQSEEEQGEEEQSQETQNQETQNQEAQSQDKQNEANQGSEAASNSAEVARTLEPGVSQGEETGKVRLEDKDGNTHTYDKSTNTIKPDIQTPPVDPNPVVPDPVVPDPVVPPIAGGTIVETIPAGGYFVVHAYPAILDEAYNITSPSVQRVNLPSDADLLVITEGQDLEKSGDLYWREIDSAESVRNPTDHTVANDYLATIWGPPVSNLPATGTLKYSLAAASAVHTNNVDLELTQFNLQVELIDNLHTANMKVDFEFSDGLKVGQKEFEYALLDTATGGFSININDITNTNNNRPSQLTYYQNGDPVDCTDCVLGVVGFLSGEQGKQAGVAYRLQIGQTPDTYNGAAILNKVP